MTPKIYETRAKYVLIDRCAKFVSCHHCHGYSSLQVCLLLVGETQVWAGSFDTCIYVIDIDTRTCNQALIQHTDMVSDLTQSDDHRSVLPSAAILS